MKRALWPLAGFVALAVVLAVGLMAARNRTSSNQVILQSPLIGRAQPAFELPDLLNPGATVSAETFGGRWRLINVWGTWCVECKHEHAALLAIRQQAQVRLIGLNWKDDDAAAIAWLARLGDPYDRVAADRDGRVAIDWGVYGAPESFLVDPAGTVCAKRVGPMTLEIWQQQFLPRLAALACD